MHRVLLAASLAALSLACTRGDRSNLFAADAQASQLEGAQAGSQSALALPAPQLAQAGASAGGSGGDVPATPLPSLAPLVKRLRPVVVNINSKYRQRRGGGRGKLPQGHPQVGPRGNGGNGNGEDDEEDGSDPMEQLRRRFGQPRPDQREVGGLGSGFLIGDGLVITNNHVVQIQDGAEGRFRAMDTITVITDDLANGGVHEFTAKLIGADPKSDIALLRMDDPKAKALAGAVLGDSDALEVGDYVVAIGEPFGLQATVTAGIVSAKERSQFGGPYSDYLQTDASINPGNSGGPLFNLRGEVVGVNSAIISGANTIGFAIPIAVVKQILPQLKEKGKVVRGYLGVQVQALSQDTAQQLGLKNAQGALVADVIGGGPADAAGLKAGDVITHVNGKAVADNNALTREVGAVPPGALVKLDYVRDTKPGSLSVKVKARPEDEEGAGGAGAGNDGDAKQGDPLGLVIESLTPDLARRARVEPGTKGVVVTDVAQESVAAGAGIEPGDVIVKLNKTDTATSDDYVKAAKALKPGDVVLLRVRRANSATFLTLRIPK